MIRKLFFLGLVVGLAYRGRNFLANMSGSRGVKNMLPDGAGNYDLDGVSYDKGEHEVVMSGDKSRESSTGIGMASTG